MKLKKSQIYGITAIVLGVLLFIPLLLAAYTFLGFGAAFFQDIAVNNFFQGGDFLHIMIGIFTWLTLTAAIALIIIGILMLINYKTERHYKVLRILFYIAGSVAAANGIFAIIFAIKETGLGVGAGSIILLIAGIIVLLTNLVLKKIIKETPAVQ